MRSLGLLVLVACTPVEVEVRGACVARDGVLIPGTQRSTASLMFTIDDLGALQELAEIDGELILDRIAIEPVDGSPNIAEADATMTAADLPALELSCGRGMCMDDGAIVLSAPMSPDVGAYVETGAISLDVSVKGSLPAEAWVADLAVCMTGNFEHDL